MSAHLPNDVQLHVHNDTMKIRDEGRLQSGRWTVVIVKCKTNVQHLGKVLGRDKTIVNYLSVWLASVGQSICHYVPVASDSSIFHCSVCRSPTSMFG